MFLNLCIIFYFISIYTFNMLYSIDLELLCMSRGEKGTLLLDPKIVKIARRNNNRNRKKRLQEKLKPQQNQIAKI